MCMTTACGCARSDPQKCTPMRSHDLQDFTKIKSNVSARFYEDKIWKEQPTSIPNLQNSKILSKDFDVFGIVIKMQVSSNICSLITSMMVFVSKIPSINHINKSSTNKVFAGCVSIPFRNRFSSRYFLFCTLLKSTLLDFPI